MIFEAGRIRSGLENAKETRPRDEAGNSEPDSLRCGGSQGTLKSVPLTTVLAAAGSSIRKSKALPVQRRNKDFKEQDEVLKKKRMIRVQLYGSTSFHQSRAHPAKVIRDALVEILRIAQIMPRVFVGLDEMNQVNGRLF